MDKERSGQVPGSASGMSGAQILPGLPPQAGCSQVAPRKGAQLSLLKAGRDGPSHPEEDQVCPPTALSVIQQGPPLVSQPCLGYISLTSWACMLLFPDEIPSFQTKSVLVLEKHAVVATGI